MAQLNSWVSLSCSSPRKNWVTHVRHLWINEQPFASNSDLWSPLGWDVPAKRFASCLHDGLDLEDHLPRVSCLRGRPYSLAPCLRQKLWGCWMSLQHGQVWLPWKVQRPTTLPALWLYGEAVSWVWQDGRKPIKLDGWPSLPWFEYENSTATYCVCGWGLNIVCCICWWWCDVCFCLHFFDIFGLCKLNSDHLRNFIKLRQKPYAIPGLQSFLLFHSWYSGWQSVQSALRETPTKPRKMQDYLHDGPCLLGCAHAGEADWNSFVTSNWSRITSCRPVTSESVR